MTRSWGQFLGDADAAPDSDAQEEGFFSRLRDSLGKTRRAMTEQLAVAAFDPADDDAWERLEEALIAADVGVPTAFRRSCRVACRRRTARRWRRRSS